jgi:hypothetical protein
MKNNLEQQIEDWNDLIRLMYRVRELPKEEKKPFIDEFYSEVLKYSKKYHTKFDPLNEPELK